MKPKLVSIIMLALLAAACGQEQTNSDGNGPGNADGVGGRADPPLSPATDERPAAGQNDAAADPNVDSATAPPSQPSQQ